MEWPTPSAGDREDVSAQLNSGNTEHKPHNSEGAESAKRHAVPGTEHSEASEWSGTAETCATTETDTAGTGQASILELLLEYWQMNTSNQSSLDKVCLVQKFKPLRVWFH